MSLLELETMLETVRGAELDASQVIAFVTAAALIEINRELVGINASVELIEPRISSQ